MKTKGRLARKEPFHSLCLQELPLTRNLRKPPSMGGSGNYLLTPVIPKYRYWAARSLKRRRLAEDLFLDLSIADDSLTIFGQWGGMQLMVESLVRTMSMQKDEVGAPGCCLRRRSDFRAICVFVCGLALTCERDYLAIGGKKSLKWTVLIGSTLPARSTLKKEMVTAPL